MAVGDEQRPLPLLMPRVIKPKGRPGGALNIEHVARGTRRDPSLFERVEEQERAESRADQTEVPPSTAPAKLARTPAVSGPARKKATTVRPTARKSSIQQLAEPGTYEPGTQMWRTYQRTLSHLSESEIEGLAAEQSDIKQEQSQIKEDISRMDAKIDQVNDNVNARFDQLATMIARLQQPPPS